MTALTRTMRHFSAALGIVGTAISTAAALRLTHPAQTGTAQTGTAQIHPAQTGTALPRD